MKNTRRKKSSPLLPSPTNLARSIPTKRDPTTPTSEEAVEATSEALTTTEEGTTTAEEKIMATVVAEAVTAITVVEKIMVTVVAEVVTAITEAEAVTLTEAEAAAEVAGNPVVEEAATLRDTMKGVIIKKVATLLLLRKHLTLSA